VEVLSLSADTTESDLKQRREIVGGDVVSGAFPSLMRSILAEIYLRHAWSCQRLRMDTPGQVFVDAAPVRAALHGRVLLLEGIERAERNVLPTLNNLLEAREMDLDDGRRIVSPHTWGAMLSQEGGEDGGGGGAAAAAVGEGGAININRPERAEEASASAEEVLLRRRGLCPAHPDFMVVVIGLPVPPYPGKPLDPPLRSRFQGTVASPPLSGRAVLEAIEADVPQLLQMGGGAGTAAAGRGLGDGDDRAARVVGAAAQQLVEFAEVTAALIRSEQAAEGRGGSESGMLARLDLAPFVDAALTVAAFPHTPVVEALRRAMPALLPASSRGGGSSGGGGALQRALREASVQTFGQQQPRRASPYSLQLTRDGTDIVFASTGSEHGPLVRRVLPLGPSEAGVGRGGDDSARGGGGGGGRAAFVELEPHSRLLCEMMAACSSSDGDGAGSNNWSGDTAPGGRDLLIVGPKGSGKSAIAAELLRQLGWGDTPLVYPLFKDISARDLLQSRDTDAETGDTVWRDSPLVVRHLVSFP
jgi:hypothetical protein